MPHFDKQIFAILILFAIDAYPNEPPKDAKYKTQKVNAITNDDIFIRFITPGSKDSCSYNLSFGDSKFTADGIHSSSERYPGEHILRTTFFVDNVFGYILVVIRLKQIKPSDAGVYNCKFVCVSHNSSQHILLRVYYPPEPAVCEWHNARLAEVNPAGFSVLQCKAKNGYPKAGIICYSMNEEKTLAHTPLSLSGIRELTATFWFKREINISCCSVSRKFKKARGHCADYHSLEFFNKNSADQNSDISRTLPITPYETQQLAAAVDVSNGEPEIVEYCDSPFGKYCYAITAFLCVIIAILFFILVNKYILQTTQGDLSESKTL